MKVQIVLAAKKKLSQEEQDRLDEEHEKAYEAKYGPDGNVNSFVVKHLKNLGVKPKPISSPGSSVWQIPAIKDPIKARAFADKLLKSMDWKIQGKNLWPSKKGYTDDVAYYSMDDYSNCICLDLEQGRLELGMM